MTQVHDTIITFPCFLNPEKRKSIRKYWAWAHRSGARKSTLVKTDEWLRKPNGLPHLSEDTGVYRKPGWLQAEHHILYNIIRGVPIERGFTPGIPGKRWAPNQDGFGHALESLIWKVDNAQKAWYNVNKGNLNNMTFRYLKETKEFLEPFRTVTLGDLISIDTTVLKQYLRSRKS